MGGWVNRWVAAANEAPLDEERLRTTGVFLLASVLERFQRLELPPEEWRAGRRLCGSWRAILRWTTFDDVADVNVVPRNTGK